MRRTFSSFERRKRKFWNLLRKKKKEKIIPVIFITKAILIFRSILHPLTIHDDVLLLLLFFPLFPLHFLLRFSKEIFFKATKRDETRKKFLKLICAVSRDELERKIDQSYVSIRIPSRRLSRIARQLQVSTSLISFN